MTEETWWKDNDSDSDDDRKRSHLNRRLESERTENGSVSVQTGDVLSKPYKNPTKFKAVRGKPHRIVLLRGIEGGPNMTSEGDRENKSTRTNKNDGLEWTDLNDHSTLESKPNCSSPRTHRPVVGSGTESEEFKLSTGNGKHQWTLEHSRKRSYDQMMSAQTFATVKQEKIEASQEEEASENRVGKITSIIRQLFGESKEQQLMVRKISTKASVMWRKIINAPEVREPEPVRKKRKGSKEAVQKEDGEGSWTESGHYEERLLEFVDRHVGQNLRRGTETVYERRIKEMMEQPEWPHFLREFYIAPAKIEVLYSRLTEEMSPVQCLSHVCQLQGWPQPEYQTKDAHGHRTMASCSLKGVTLWGSSAANSRLAQDLAAATFLDHLAVPTRDSRDRTTYF